VEKEKYMPQGIDAIDYLIRQHREMEALLQQVADQISVGSYSSLFDHAGDRLTVHIKAEEEIFYPAVKAARTEDNLLESLEEHLSLKRLLADLIELPQEDQTFEPKFKVLKEQTEHHHKEEEEHLFPVVRELLEADRRIELGNAMDALQNKLGKAFEPRAAVANETTAAAPLK
jgi:hemerythrin superfamily protein